MKSEVLYNDNHVQFDKFEDGTYRITLFNDENHWNGDMTFTKQGIVYCDIDFIDNKE